MGGAPLILALTMVAVDPGWEPTRNGGYRFILQVPPAQVTELQQNGSITSRIPDELVGRVTEVEIRIGEGSVPRPAITDVSSTSSYPPPPDSVGTVRAQDTGFSAPPPLNNALDQAGAAAVDAARTAGERTIDNLADDAKRLFDQIPPYESGTENSSNGSAIGARSGAPATTAPGSTATSNGAPTTSVPRSNPWGSSNQPGSNTGAPRTGAPTTGREFTNGIPSGPSTSNSAATRAPATGETGRGFPVEQDPGWSSTSPSTTRNTAAGTPSNSPIGGYAAGGRNSANPAAGSSPLNNQPAAPGAAASGNYAGMSAPPGSGAATTNLNANSSLNPAALNRPGAVGSPQAGEITIGDVTLNATQYADLTPEDVKLLRDVRRVPRVNPTTGFEEVQLIDAVTTAPLAYNDPRYIDMLDLLVHLDQLSRVDAAALKKQVLDRQASDERWRQLQQTNRELAQKQQELRIASNDPRSLAGSNFGAGAQTPTGGATPAFGGGDSNAEYLANRGGAVGSAQTPATGSPQAGPSAATGRESFSPSDTAPPTQENSVQTMPLVILILIISILVNCYMAYCISRVLQRYRNLVASTRVSPLSA